MDYLSKFNHLSQYAPKHVGTNVEKKHWFVHSLNTKLQTMLTRAWQTLCLCQEWSLDIVPHLCRFRTIHCWPLDQEFVVLAIYSSKLDTLAIPLREKTTAH